MKQLFLALILSLIFAAATDAATFYVAKTGSDSYSCAQATNPSTARLTIRGGLGCVVAGDTLSIKAGTYSETISSPPSGTSWANAVTISRYGSDVVVLNGGPNPVLNLWSPTISYVIFNGLILDGANTGNNTVSIGNGAHHIRIANSEIKNAQNQGIQILEGSDFNEIINCSVHDNGSQHTFDHGLYISSSNNLIEGSRIYNNATYGLHFYNSGRLTINRNIVRNNTLYGNNRMAGFAYHIIFSNGDGNTAYNNVLRDCACGGFQIHASASNTRVYNNTIYRNSSGAGIVIDAGSTGAIISNNIVYQNAGTIVDGGTGSVISNNLTTDPKFKSEADGDFSLQIGSSAIDAGQAITEVLTDLAGTTRPQGCCFDIGAYEFGSAGVTPPPTPGITVDSSYSGYSPAPIADGVIDAAGGTVTTWASAYSGVSDHWIHIVFSSPQIINSASIYWAFNNFQQKFMTAQTVHVQYWDGSAYQTGATMTYPGADVPSSVVQFPAVTTTRLRFLQPVNQGNPTYPGVFWVTEINHGVLAPPSPPGLLTVTSP